MYMVNRYLTYWSFLFAQESRIGVSPDLTYFVLDDLEMKTTYWVRATANTAMGEGDSTETVTVVPKNNG